MYDTTHIADLNALAGSIRPDLIPDIFLERQLGTGATSTVYLGLDKANPGRQVAVKIITQYLVSQEDARRRWDREAKLILSLDHPNIVKGLHAGVASNRPYLVMEYLQGETLADRLRRLGKLPEEEVIHIAESTLAGLEAAWSKNIIHRDLKPANLIWLRDDTIKIMDFGLAKFADDTSITMEGAIVGTPLYVSPEQARCDREITVLSDLYSLGIMLFHLAAGKPPFSELNTSLLLTRKITDDVPDVRELDPTVSNRLAFFIHQLCQRSAEERPQSPALARDLLHQLNSGAISSTNFILKKSRRRKLSAADFTDIPPEDQNRIIQTIAADSQLDSKPHFLGKGEVLFYEDEDSRDCYILLSGSVEILKSGRRIAMISEAGAFIGEMGPLRGVPRSATVAAVEDTILLIIAEDVFEDFFLRHPEMAMTLAQTLAQRLDRTSEQLNQTQARLANLSRHVREMNALL